MHGATCNVHSTLSSWFFCVAYFWNGSNDSSVWVPPKTHTHTPSEWIKENCVAAMSHNSLSRCKELFRIAYDFSGVSMWVSEWVLFDLNVHVLACIPKEITACSFSGLFPSSRLTLFGVKKIGFIELCDGISAFRTRFYDNRDKHNQR